MTEDGVIWMVSPSVEDDRPVIEFDASINQGIDWGLLDAVLQGERPLTQYQEISVTVSNPDATSWGFYSVPGTLGLISEKVVEHVGRHTFRLYNLLPAKLNDASYFFLKPIETLACLDLARSDIVTFRSNPSRIKEIRKYAFNKAMIPEPLVFSIPEFPGLFTTPTVSETVVRSNIPGVQFAPLG